MHSPFQGFTYLSSLVTDQVDILIEQDLKQFVIILLVAISAASLPKIFIALRQIPYTLLLVIVGLGLALANLRLIDLSPGMILFIFLPPLLFEAAWKTKWADLRREFVPSLLFAVGGVLIALVVVGWVLHQWMAVPWVTALLIGACLAATDSASVLGVFREAGARDRLRTLLEGESLLNDGASVVTFSVLLEFAISPHPISPIQTLVQFIAVCGIGAGVGGVIGAGVALLTQRYQLSEIEQSLTLVTAYGAYLLVEDLGGSGVIGVVVAGLVIGNFSVLPGQEPLKRPAMVEFWDFVTFLINSIVFLLLGDQIILPLFFANVQTAAVAVVAVLASRAIAIFGLGTLSGWLTRNPISWPDQIVLWWAGLRGSVSIALALSIPATMGDREQIISSSFGVVFFTLLVQGMTIQPLLATLNLLEDQSIQQAYLTCLARQDALQQVLAYLAQNETDPLIAPELHQKQLELIHQQIQALQTEITTLKSQHPSLQDFNLKQQYDKLVAIETETYSKLVQSGVLKQFPDSVIPQIISEPGSPASSVSG
jgi:monovalent cation:H+ antiporter, CPA1 family